jgi:hypothetical protein
MPEFGMGAQQFIVSPTVFNKKPGCSGTGLAIDILMIGGYFSGRYVLHNAISGGLVLYDNSQQKGMLVNGMTEHLLVKGHFQTLFYQFNKFVPLILLCMSPTDFIDVRQIPVIAMNQVIEQLVVVDQSPVRATVNLNTIFFEVQLHGGKNDAVGFVAFRATFPEPVAEITMQRFVIILIDPLAERLRVMSMLMQRYD